MDGKLRLEKQISKESRGFQSLTIDYTSLVKHLKVFGNCRGKSIVGAHGGHLHPRLTDF